MMRNHLRKSKLTKEQREEVARLYWLTERSIDEIAFMFDVSKQNVYALAQRRKEKYKEQIDEYEQSLSSELSEEEN